MNENPAEVPGVGSLPTREIDRPGVLSYPPGYHPLLAAIDQAIERAQTPEERHQILLSRREALLQVEIAKELEHRREMGRREFSFKVQSSRIALSIGVIGVGAGVFLGNSLLMEISGLVGGAGLFLIVPEYVRMVFSKVPAASIQGSTNRHDDPTG